MNFPWEIRQRPDGIAAAFRPGFLCHVFTNRDGNDFVAFVDLNTKVIRFSGCDIDWHWYTINCLERPEIQLRGLMLRFDEVKWLQLLQEQAAHL